MNKNECPSESGTHQFVTDGYEMFCRMCGDPLHHRHALERDAKESTPSKEIFNCTHPHCEYVEEELNDAQP